MESPKTAWLTMEMTVSDSYGMIGPATIRNDRPRNIVARMTAMMTIVWAAFLDSGGLNAGMPLEMASVPVMTAEPTANARRIRNRVSGSVAGGNSGGAGGFKLPVEFR